MRKAVFLDRDNTLIKDDGYFHDPEKIVFLPGVAEGLRTLQSAGFALLVVANQSGIGRGYFPESDTIAVNKKMTDLLRQKGVQIEKIYYCPHAPEANCACRKPKPFLIQKAAEEFGIDLAKSFFVGDYMKDMEAGRNAGTMTVFLGPAAQDKSPVIDFYAPDLPGAAERILNHEKFHRPFQT
jgi:D-glycero-D-manno-heptose 1,7-bisphosphate phosphatase